MYRQLIYTRCKQGVDLLKGGAPLGHEGYKVYSCSPDLWSPGFVDLPFLLSACQVKPPFREPDLVEDVYLYYVPDQGPPFLINSHPRRFTPIAGATYAQRPGNFLNHAYIGNFTQQYLWELMHLPELWYAQQEDEGYYYREPPTPLPVLTSLPAPSAATSAITLKEIAHFIAAGRQEGLAQAVAFLLEQYQLPPSQRRYLIISEVNSREMELWLAAIQMAFSPRMAAALSFATRLDRFTGSNRYTVNRSGSYMPQINLQDPEQTLRYRAMILGLDARDHINLRELRPGSAAPYVVLDGKKGKAYFTQDISHPYFTLITTFSPTHLSFGRDFLQDTTLTQPNYQIFQLYEVYTMLLNFALPPVLNND